MDNVNGLRTAVRSFYDAQKMRIMVGNRLVANLYSTMGQKPGTKLDESLTTEGKELLRSITVEYAQITGAVANPTARNLARYFRTHEGVITRPFEYELTHMYHSLLDAEHELSKTIAFEVEQFDIWEDFLKGVRGCGPLMAAVIISEFDPYKARYASSFHKYAGLDVAPDGRGRGKYKDHLVKVQYTNKKGVTDEKSSITFNPFLKTKLLGVLGPSFLKTGSDYAKTYYDYKHRLENHAVYKDTTPIHRHKMALRYMVKLFLIDLYVAWRTLKGLEVAPSYAEAKLGIIHGGIEAA
ncbi:MAG: hypothetical protein XE05_1827 [Thermotogales bacterium 46_20]|nr:MAG: hypothetical protein XE05_1827 [Thermotogales bacterium 46_20]